MRGILSGTSAAITIALLCVVPSVARSGGSMDSRVAREAAADGARLDEMEDPAFWSASSGPAAVTASVGSAPGHAGASVQLDFTLGPPTSPPTDNWVRIERSFGPPVAVGAGDTLRFWLRGSAPSANSLAVSIAGPDELDGPFEHRLGHSTHVPAWAAVSIPLSAMTGPQGIPSAMPATIARLRFEVSASSVDADSGGLGSIAIDDVELLTASARIVPGGFSEAGGDLAGAAGAAGRMLEAQQPGGLAWSWFGGDFRACVRDQALALLVWSRAFPTNADRMADALVSLQAADGSWAECYGLDGGAVVVEGTSPSSVAWVVTALARHADDRGGRPYRDAALRGAEWLRQLQQQRSDGSVADSTADNVVAWLAFRTTGMSGEADAVAAVLDDSWCAAEMRFCHAPGDGALVAEDQTLGALFARSVGRTDRALAALSYAHFALAGTSFDGSRRGLGDPGPSSVRNELTAQYVAAGGPDASRFLADLRAQRVGGWLPGAPDSFETSEGSTTVANGVAPLAWLFFVEAGGPFPKGLSVVETADPMDVAPGAAVEYRITAGSRSPAVVEVDAVDVLLPQTGIVSAAPQPSEIRAEGWATGPDLHLARVGLGTASCNGTIYAVGGHDGVTVTDRVEAYDPDAGAWFDVAPLNVARQELGAVALGGRLYAVGGRGVSGASEVTEVFDPATGQWSLAAPLPEPRYASAVAVLGDVVHLIGGRDRSGAPTATVFRYDSSSDAWTVADRALRRPVAEASAAVVDGRIYVFGGDGSGDVQVQEWFTTYARGAWSLTSPMAHGRSRMATVHMAGVLYAFGGGHPADGPAGEVLDTSLAFHPGTGQWFEGASMPDPRAGAAAATLDGRVWVIGGTDGNQALATVGVYTPSSVVWRGLVLEPNRLLELTVTARVSPDARPGDLAANAAAVLGPDGEVVTRQAKSVVGAAVERSVLASGVPRQEALVMAAGRRTVHAAWQQDDRIAVSRLQRSGDAWSWTGPREVVTGTEPAVTVAARSVSGSDAEDVHLVWRQGSTMLHSRSGDGGTTFGPATVVTTTVAPTASVVDVAADGHGGLYAVWSAWQEQFGVARLDGAVSTDGGRTWSTSTIVDQFCGLWSGPPRVAVTPAGVLHAVWHAAESCGAKIQIQHVRSVDGGTAWVRQPRDPALEARMGNGAYHPDIALDGEDLVYIVANRDTGHSQDIVLLVSDDGGATFRSAPVVVTDRPVRSVYAEFDQDWGPMTAPSIEVDAAGAVWVSWSTTANGDHDIWLDRSLDGGTTFGLDRPVAFGAGDQRRPDLAAARDRCQGALAVGWIDAAGGGKVDSAIMRTWSCRAMLPLARR